MVKCAAHTSGLIEGNIAFRNGTNEGNEMNEPIKVEKYNKNEIYTQLISRSG